MSSPRLRPLTLAFALALFLGACHAWHPQPVASPEPDRVLGGPVRVTRTDGPPIVLAGVTVGRDSLYGREHDKPYGSVVIPLSSVRMVEARRVNALGTVSVVALSVAAVLGVVAALLANQACYCPT
jgi:hypothetical protein